MNKLESRKRCMKYKNYMRKHEMFVNTHSKNATKQLV